MKTSNERINLRLARTTAVRLRRHGRIAMRRLSRAIRLDGPELPSRPRSNQILHPAFACLLLAAVCIAATPVVIPLVTIDSARAQGWFPPWETEQRPVPRAPVYTQPPPPQQPVERVQPIPGSNYSQGYANRPPICLQLEQRLALEANRGTQAQSQLPQIEASLREADREMRRAERELERRDCYDSFLFFGKSLRNNRTCRRLAGSVEAAKRKMSELEAQRQDVMQSGNRSLRDDIVRELARNNCGAAYQQEARRTPSGPFASLWQDGDTGWGGNRYGGVPYATYRTICVRLCDGYFFPVSFSTLPSHFERDQEICQQKCAAPAELFYHQNPGAGMAEAQSHKTKLAYASLRTAFRYRKEFVKGCSCKGTEYLPEGSAPITGATSPRPPGQGQRAQAPAPPATQQPPAALRPWR